MADKPHPSRPYTPTAGREQSAGIASTREGEPRPVSTEIAEDIKAGRNGKEAEPAPETKPKRKRTFAQAIAAIERVMEEVSPGFRPAVRIWFDEQYGNK